MLFSLPVTMQARHWLSGLAVMDFRFLAALGMAGFLESYAKVSVRGNEGCEGLSGIFIPMTAWGTCA